MKEDETNLSAELDKVIQLLTGSHSANLHERHIAAISRLCKSNVNGFAIRDLPKVQHLVELTLQLLASGLEDFLAPACELIQTLSKPFIKRTSTDEFKMLNIIASILVPVGRILAENLPNQLQLCAIEMLSLFATAHAQKLNTVDIKLKDPESFETGPARQFHTNQSLIAKSGVVKWVVEGLHHALVASNAKLSKAILETLLQFSFLPESSFQMVQGGLMSLLPVLLSHNYHDEVVLVSVELLWNVLEHSLNEKSLPAESSILQPNLEASASPSLLMFNSAVSANGRSQNGFDAACLSEEHEPSGTPASVESSSKGMEDRMDFPGVRPLFGEEADQDFEASNAENGSENMPQVAEEPSFAVEYEGIGRPSVEDSPTELSPSGFAAAEVDEEAARALDVSEPQEGATEPIVSGQEIATEGTPPDEPIELNTEITPQMSLALPLTNLLRTLLLEGCRAIDKELRNDLLVICHLLIKSGPYKEPFSRTGLFSILIGAATSPEVNERQDVVKRFAWTSEDRDFEMKQLVFSTVANGCELPSVLQEALAADFLPLLLMYSEPSPSSKITRWNGDQLSMLRTAALDALHDIAPLCAHKLLDTGGIDVLVRVAGETRMKYPQRTTAVTTLHRVLMAVPEIRARLADTGVINMLLDILQASSGSGAPSSQQALLEQWSLTLITALCKGSEEVARTLRKSQGIAVLLSLLQRHSTADPTLPSSGAVAAVDALWTCVIPYRKSLAHFLVGGGCDLLLLLLERGHRSNRPIVLGALADMLENPRAQAFFHDWKSQRSGYSSGQLLISIWQEEDGLRSMTVGGLLANISRPLDGLQQRKAWLPPETIMFGGLGAKRKQELEALEKCVADANILTKVYAVLKVVGFETLTGLTPEQEAAMRFIENYVKFKQGEVWQRIRDEFEAENMRPTYPDRMRLSSGIDSSEAMAMAVRETQASHLGKLHDQAAAAEARMLNNMIHQRALEKEARFYHKDASQLTLAELRAAKAKREEMLRNSIRSFVVQDWDEQSQGGTRPGTGNEAAVEVA